MQIIVFFELPSVQNSATYPGLKIETPALNLGIVNAKKVGAKFFIAAIKITQPRNPPLALAALEAPDKTLLNH